MNKLALLVVAGALVACAASDCSAQVLYTTYYQPVTVYSPPVAYAPPVAQTVFYAPAAPVTYEPVPVVRTRYRPILGGSVTRVSYRYAPVAHYTAMPVVYGY